MRSRPLLFLTLAALLGGCATAGTVGPDGLARLEHARTENPQSAAANRALGIAYYQLHRYPEAREALQRAAAADPKDGTTQLFLGMTAEAQNDLVAARAAYSSYVEYGRTARVRRLLQDRLAALNQKELVLAAKQAVANERQLASVPGTPNVVAVLPLSFTGSDTTLRPLGRGLAELLTTDLAQSPKLTVVERARVQALVDEIKLQQSGATDQSTNVRAGRILEAGRLVAGGITQTGQDLRVDAPIVNTANDQVVGSPSDSRALDEVFTLEKNLAFEIFNSLGVTLTTAERNQIEQRPTKSLAAFLAYSRGLSFQDEGRFDDATRLFDQALRIDPGFSAARQSAQQSSAAAQGQNVTPATVEVGLRGSGEGAIVAGASQGVVVTAPPTALTNMAATTAQGLNPSGAQVATTGGGNSTTGTITANNNGGAQATGTDNITNKTATVQIVVHIPHL
ncbi:MAG TPA: tetratricopeptide repeat protein [Gemmatimonadaceae bacterium]|nr:tetratricopeptide repeat protein [Gemmatimonadaceae bacterium]